MVALDEGWADPARRYGSARRSRLLLDQAREQAAALVGCRPDEISFPSSGTAAVHAGVLGVRHARARVGSHVVVSAVEHSSVLAAAAHPSGAAVGTPRGTPARAGSPRTDPADHVTRVPVDASGRVHLDGFVRALRDDTALACLQSANHEVGTRQPVAEAAAACRDAGVPLLVDAAQSLGWERPAEGWSLVTASAHKWGGPAGVGLLAVRTGTRWRSPWPEDERGGGRAPGYENVPGVVAAVTALEAVRASAAHDAARDSALIDRVRRVVAETVPDVEVLGDAVERLPHIATFTCLYADGESLVAELDREGFAVSSGSSCSASSLRPSHVLVAMGASTSGSVRVSLPRDADEADVERFLEVLPSVVARVRALLGAEGL